MVEESLKGAVLFGLLWRRRQELDGPTDGIIYAAMVGLGFAMMENIGYYIGALVRPEVGGAQLLGFTFVLRGVLSPFAHPVFTSMTGIGVAYAATHRHGGWAGARRPARRHDPARAVERADRLRPARARRRLRASWPACSVALVAVIVADRRRMVRLIWRFLPAYEATGVVTEADLRMLVHAARAAAGPGSGRAAPAGGRRGPGHGRLPAGRDRAGAVPSAGRAAA